MADANDIEFLAMSVGGSPDFTTDQLGEIIDGVTTLDEAAAVVWEIRAAKYHGLVNISESGSSRSLGDMHKNALAMAAYYRGKGAAIDAGASAGRTRTGRIVRA